MDFTFDNAVKLDTSCTTEHVHITYDRNFVTQCNVTEETACKSDGGIQSVNNISEKVFGIPTIAELDEATTHGLREILQRTSPGPAWINPIWSSSIYGSYQSDEAFSAVWMGAGGQGGSSESGGCEDQGCALRSAFKSIRCVGR